MTYRLDTAPKVGNILVMTIPDGESVPSGWTRILRDGDRYKKTVMDPSEYVFPYPVVELKFIG